MLQRGKNIARYGCAVTAAILCLMASGTHVLAGTVDEVPYPEGFRHWVHIKSGVVSEGNPGFPRFAGMHHVYANETALAGFKTGKFPEGSVLVFDDLNTKAGPGSLETTDRRQLDVMQKMASGWVFGEFAGDSHTERSVTAAQAEKECAGCHSFSHRDSVFSKFAE